MEALQVNREINKGVLTIVHDDKIHALKEELTKLANNCFYAHNTPITIVHAGEMAVLATAIIRNSDAVVIDERTTRELIEDPESIAELMKRKMHTKIKTNKEHLRKLKQTLGNMKVIRSIEMGVMGYELGWFEKYLTQDSDARKTLIEAILWGIKMRGASISQREIDRIVKMAK